MLIEKWRCSELKDAIKNLQIHLNCSEECMEKICRFALHYEATELFVSKNGEVINVAYNNFDRCFNEAISNGWIEDIKKLSEKADSHALRKGMIHAIYCNKATILKILLKLYGVSFDLREVFEEALAQNNEFCAGLVAAFMLDKENENG